MPRKPRVRPEHDIKKIEIERNVIEQFLMDAKDFAKKNRKMILYSFIGVAVAAVLAIGTLIAVDIVNTRNEQRLEKIMDNYQKYSQIGDNEKVKGLIVEMKQFIDSTYFGFPLAMGYYSLGNMYYGQKQYKEAMTCLVKYADKKPKTALAPIALLKAAIALEEANDLKGAKDIYTRLMDRYSESIIADQIYYNAARVSGKMKDIITARNYYKKVISTYPESAFAQESRKRLFVLGAM